MSDVLLWKRIRNRILFGISILGASGCLVGLLYSAAPLIRH
jgi:hypothetical protein